MQITENYSEEVGKALAARRRAVAFIVNRAAPRTDSPAQNPPTPEDATPGMRGSAGSLRPDDGTRSPAPLTPPDRGES